MKLRERELDLLQVLGRLAYVTPGQLDRWGIPTYAVSRLLPRLESLGLVQVTRKVRPHIIALTHKGGSLIERPLPSGKSYSSWAVMAHRCYRNEAELFLRQHYPRFTFFNRKYAYARGLNPARGEHGGSDESGRLYLVLLDDYFMHPRRIAHCWSRPHTPNARYYTDTASRRWSEVADALLVVSSDGHQFKRHRDFLAKCAEIRRMEEGMVPRQEIRDQYGLSAIDTIQQYAAVPSDAGLYEVPSLWDIHA